MFRTNALMISAVLLGSAAHAQATDRTKAYIGAGFRAMDANRDGKVVPAEFESFMQARMAKQTARFDAAFRELDANRDGRITSGEAKAVPQLAANFAEVDANRDKSISKDELRAAAAAARAEEVADK